MGTTPDQQPSLRADALLAERRQWAAVMDRLDEGLRHDVPVVDALRAAANVDTRGEAQLRTAIDAGLRAHVAAEHGRLDRYPPTDGDYHDARQNQAYADAEARSYDDGRQFDTHAEHRGDR